MKNNLKNKVAIITGGSGALGGIMALGLATQGVKVAVLGRTESTIQNKVDEIQKAGGYAIGLVANVLNRIELEEAKDTILNTWNSIDILVNAAGGNMKGTTIMPEESFFDMNLDDFDAVTELNLKGTVLPTLVFGKQMAKQEEGTIINISSMAAQQALTRVVGYSTSKASNIAPSILVVGFESISKPFVPKKSTIVVILTLYSLAALFNLFALPAILFVKLYYLMYLIR